MHNTICFTCFLLLCISCDSNKIFDAYTSLENGNWEKNNTLQFDINIQDTLSKNNLFFHVRNNNQYEFSNLFLISKMTFPNGLHVVDTLEYEMADANGRWLGTGYTDIKESKLYYKENVVFPVSGTYQISIQHAMRKMNILEGMESLTGITDVGFRIETVTK